MTDGFTTIPELIFEGTFTRATEAEASIATLDVVRFRRTVCIQDIRVTFAPVSPIPPTLNKRTPATTATLCASCASRLLLLPQQH